MLIDISSIRGESGTGFEKSGDKGEFECGNCYYFRDGSCGQKIMMEKSKQPRTADGRVKVDEEDCCEFVRRMGREEPEEKAETSGLRDVKRG